MFRNFLIQFLFVIIRENKVKFQIHNNNSKTMREEFTVESKLNDEQKMNQALGVQGKFMWPIRLLSFLGFAATLVVNYVVGMKTGEVSDKYHLYVTPPGYFFTIWAVIYTALAVISVYNLIKNVWSVKVHIFFGLSNALNMLWIIIFSIGNNAAVYACSFILLALVPAILLTWIQMGNVSPKQFNMWTYVCRNVFAFYLGWVIAATNLNLGMDIVFWWGASKQTQMIIFWIMAPLCAVGAFCFNCVKYGKVGCLSCFCLWISVAWAFAGAAITSYNCQNNLQSLC